MLLATAACNFSTSELQKVPRDRQCLNILTWTCASRRSGVQFFNISTSKSAPRMLCFVHFDLKMCFSPKRRAIFRHRNGQKWSGPHVFVHFHFKMHFSPQRHAIFRHRNFQKWSGADVFCTFSLENALRATAACNF